MTEALFRDDGYLQHCTATVLRVDGQQIVLDRTVCYPNGGGQPGDHAVLLREDGSSIVIVDTRRYRLADQVAFA